MVSRLVSGGAVAALAGAAMFIAASSSPSSAFTLSTRSIEQQVLSADLQDVYWCRWGRCGGWGWHRWGGGWGYRPWGWHSWGYRPWGWHRWGYWHRPWGWNRWG